MILLWASHDGVERTLRRRRLRLDDHDAQHGSGAGIRAAQHLDTLGSSMRYQRFFAPGAFPTGAALQHIRPTDI
jgi:hypothetical protein